MKENVNFELKSSRRAGKNPLLSTTVAITDMEGRPHYCYVRFSDKLVAAVGGKLPHGLLSSDPAYLHVLHDYDGPGPWPHGRPWIVYAVTVSGKKVKLWSQALPPAWLKMIPVKGTPKVKKP